MSLELDCGCDECGDRIDEGDVIYCNHCYSNLQNEIESLENRITELENELEKERNKEWLQ